MDWPGSSIAIASFIVIALPGFIFAGIRRWARGERPEDRTLSLSIARGATFAVVLTGIYMLVFGSFESAGIRAGESPDSLVIDDARRLGIAVLVLYVALPAIVSLALNRKHLYWDTPKGLTRTPVLKGLRTPVSKHGYSAMPSAWDHAVTRNQHSWVKVQRADGQWVGGWYTGGSFSTTYPEPRSIYIDKQFAMTKQGGFTEEIPSTGIFLMIGDDDLVIWTRASNLEYEENHDEG